MIVQTGSTNPRGRVRRGLRALGVVTPLVLLALVAGAGVLGPRPEPAVPEASAAVLPEPSPAMATTAPALLAGPGPGFPTVAVDLGVRSIPEAQAELVTGSGRPIAIAGVLESVAPPDACAAAKDDTRGVLSPLCERRARLVMDAGAARGEAHLHLVIPAGVRLPSAFEDAAPDEPMPVIVVGRGPVGACDGSERGCGETLAVDLLAWADGAPFDPGPVFDAGLEVPPSAIAYRHLAAAEALVVGWSGSVLIAAAVRPATVEAIDPEAAAAMTATGASPAGLVWYVRGLETEYGPARYMTSDVPPRMRWVVLDESTGSPIVTGVVDRPDGASTRGDATGSAFPATVAGLPVRDVATVIAARADVPAGRIAAVAGWLRAWADPSACLDPIDGLPAGGCPRTGLLIGAPWSDAAGTPPEGAGAVIHVEVPPGVALPDVAVGIEVEEKGPPPPVVALGRYDEAGSFVVEAVAWVSGQSLAPGRVVARDVAAAADDPIAAEAGARRDALDGATAVLRMVLAPARALAAIDPEAAARMRTAGRDAAAPLWYLRGLTASGTVTWAVVEPGTGRVLARADAG